MEIFVAKSAGFCFGVERAVKMAFDLEDQNATYTLGPIIHNDAVVNKLKQKNIHPVKSIDETNIEKLIIRSHGVGEAVYNEALKHNIDIVDATCPYVKKIHKLVSKYSKEGFHIIVIGNKDHPEIIGINGWVNNECIIIKDQEDTLLKSLDPNNKYFVVAQTTYKKQVVDNILKVLDELNIDYRFNNTICNATKERQEEAVEIAKKVDCMFVLGSSYSSNTRKLYEICKEQCERTFCIASSEELTSEMLSNTQKVGITAGASTPDNIIEETLTLIKSLSEG